jgi:sigma-B regulation protein RsbU (phosphoserine phosphatase)
MRPGIAPTSARRAKWRRRYAHSSDGTEDFEDLHENAPCGYLSLGDDGRIVKSNLTPSKWTGFARNELLGKRLRDLLNVADSIFYETHFAPLLRMQVFSTRLRSTW